MQCVAVCCSVHESHEAEEVDVAVCHSVPQCVAVCHSVPKCVAVRCSVLQCMFRTNTSNENEEQD